MVTYCDRGSENFGRFLLAVLNKSIGETVAIGQGSGDRSVGDTGGRDGFYEASLTSLMHQNGTVTFSDNRVKTKGLYMKCATKSICYRREACVTEE